MKQNYLNNKDILSEIHKSKNTYCSFRTPADHQYDLILKSTSQINIKTIRLAKNVRADRLAKAAFDAAIAEGQVVKLDKFKIPTRRISAQDLVFRVMTFEHIPHKPPKVIEMDEEAVTEYDDDTILPIKYVKVNFPPFMHYKIDDSLSPYRVGISHWKGTIEDGEYCRDHGAMTNKLALMFMKLCERYGTRGNWRGYTYNDEMQSQALLQLSQIGLQFDESKSSNPFAYYTAAITNSFTRVLNIEKRNQNVRDDILEMNDLTPSYTRQNSGGSDGHDE